MGEEGKLGRERGERWEERGHLVRRGESGEEGKLGRERGEGKGLVRGERSKERRKG